MIKSIKPIELQPQYRPILKCRCNNYQDKCKGKYIKTRRGQYTCLWSFLNKDYLI